VQEVEQPRIVISTSTVFLGVFAATIPFLLFQDSNNDPLLEGLGGDELSYDSSTPLATSLHILSVILLFIPYTIIAIIRLVFLQAVPTFTILIYQALRWMVNPLAVTASMIVVVLKPIILYGQIMFFVLVQTPVRCILWCLGLVFPLYIFVGVAALFGASIGYGGAGFARALLVFLMQTWRSIVGEDVEVHNAVTPYRSVEPPRRRPRFITYDDEPKRWRR
jgi:hypothetical protein